LINFVKNLYRMKVLVNSLQLSCNHSNIRKKTNDNKLHFDNQWQDAISGEEFVKLSHKHIEKKWSENRYLICYITNNHFEGQFIR